MHIQKKGTVVDTERINGKQKEHIRMLVYLSSKNKDDNIVYTHETNYNRMPYNDRKFI